MHVPAAAAAMTTTALGLLLVGTAPARAASDCQAAFEKWALLSSTQVRANQSEGRGAGIPNEAARRSLLDALARTRRVCGDQESDPSVHQTRTLLNINQGFIASLSVCRGQESASAPPAASEEPEAGGGWAAKAAPAPARAPERPHIAVPMPRLPPVAPPRAPPPAAPPPPAPRPPITGGPRPSVITPAPAAPKPAIAAPAIVPPTAPAAAPAPKPPCLAAGPPQGDVHALVNRNCRGHTVLAVIETRTAAGETTCKGYSIGVGVNVRAPASPRVNYECVSGQRGCNRDRLGDMFPECDW